MKYCMFFWFLFLFSGCSFVMNEAYVIPNANTLKIQNCYVQHLDKDKHYINKMIEQELLERGFNISDKNSADIVVTYQDRWFWDMTNYMISLKIQIRDSADMYPIVVGESIRTSLARKSPEDVVKEVLDLILSKYRQGI